MLNIRPAIEQDFPAILDVQRLAFGEYAGIYKASGWTTETLDNLKRDAREKRILAAEWEGSVVGSVRFWTVGGVCVIRLLSVHPDYQGKGIGKALMQEVEKLVSDAHKLHVCTMLRTSRNVVPVSQSRLSTGIADARPLQPYGHDLLLETVHSLMPFVNAESGSPLRAGARAPTGASSSRICSTQKILIESR